MKEPPSGPSKQVRAARHGFVTTRWSLVLNAQGDATPLAQKALSEFLELYRYPVYAFIKSQRYPEDEAQDLTQGFFMQLLERNDLAAVEQGRGRFRNWLLVSVKHYLSNQRDHERAQKRGGGLVRVELEDAEAFSKEMAGLTPEQAFDLHWVESLLKNALLALEKEYPRTGKELPFSELKKTLTGEAEESLKALGAKLGIEANTMRLRIFRLRRRYWELLRQEVRHTVRSCDEVSDELKFLKSILKNS
jgi:RNA polymerase sigma-70 factor (ECF subfamily)